ncbi:hypothetical protein CMK22_00255 [Candidatus Poribacteria bacterium]|nr:hypothetical protein [Candidatus Poribacteria bacterium]
MYKILPVKLKVNLLEQTLTLSYNPSFGIWGRIQLSLQDYIKTLNKVNYYFHEDVRSKFFLKYYNSVLNFD